MTQHTGDNPQDKDAEAFESSEYESFEDEFFPADGEQLVQDITNTEKKDPVLQNLEQEASQAKDKEINDSGVQMADGKDIARTFRSGASAPENQGLDP